MLVLSRRKPGETVVLRLEDGREIVVTLLENDRGKVRLGFTCDRSIQIYRGEALGEFGPASAPKEGEGDRK